MEQSGNLISTLKKTFPLLFVFTFLLQACSPTDGATHGTVTQAAFSSATPSLTSTSTPQNTPSLIPSATPTLTFTFTPQNTSTALPITPDPSVARMVVPEDIKGEVISSKGDQTGAPQGFRHHFVYPIGGFGGGGAVCDGPASEPNFVNTPTSFEAMSIDIWGEDQIDTCGWVEGETVSITVTLPDGTKETSQQISESGTSVSYRPKMEYGVQLGSYNATFASSSGSISVGFSVVRPTRPGLSTMSEKEYYAYGFDANEPVYILAYKIMKDSRLIEIISWKETTTDSHGELLIENKTSSDLLAVSDTSGTLIIWSNPFWDMFIDNKYLIQEIAPCDGSPASRLQTYDLAYVLGEFPNNVRSSPSVFADLIGTVVPGTTIYVGKEDPVCADGYLWWYVYPAVGSEPTGWTAEGKGSDYWLAPQK
jgi:hypothetical protein